MHGRRFLPTGTGGTSLHRSATARSRRAPRDEYRRVDEVTCLTSRELRERGLTRRQLGTAVRSGQMIRARRDRYLPATAPPAIVQAVRVGGRLTCLSLLAAQGVFVFSNTDLHVHLERGASRLRAPAGARQPLPHRRERESLRLHWLPLVRPELATSVRVGSVDALAHAVLCQPPRYAIATLDSAVNKGVVRRADLVELFRALPAKYGALHPLIDGRAQAGAETFVRLMVRSMDVSVEPQASFRGVGFVDLLVDGWLIIECDSKQFHSDWAQQVKDRERDLALAALGYTVLRVTAAQVFFRPDEVRAAIRGLLDAHRRRTPGVRNSA